MQCEKDWPLLALKVEEATSQGMWADFKTWKRQIMDSFLESLEKNTALPTF